MVWGGRREEGSGWGTRVYLWQIHFDIWQNQYNIVKLNKIKLKKKKTGHYSLMFWRLGFKVELDFLEQSILGFEMTAFSLGSLMAFSLCRYRIKTATEKCRMIILSSEHSHGY